MKLFLAFIVVLAFWPTTFETSLTANQKNLNDLKVGESDKIIPELRSLAVYDHHLVMMFKLAGNQMERKIAIIMDIVRDIFRQLKPGLCIDVVDTIYYDGDDMDRDGTK